eukprot:m.160359 g.160359  ORF g.160359 m.160359 type:complete len:949 (-) comp14553_c0_seq2:203-3049(-)
MSEGAPLPATVAEVDALSDEQINALWKRLGKNFKAFHYRSGKMRGFLLSKLGIEDTDGADRPGPPVTPAGAGSPSAGAAAAADGSGSEPGTPPSVPAGPNVGDQQCSPAGTPTRAQAAAPPTAAPIVEPPEPSDYLAFFDGTRAPCCGLDTVRPCPCGAQCSGVYVFPRGKGFVNVRKISERYPSSLRFRKFSGLTEAVTWLRTELNRPARTAAAAGSEPLPPMPTTPPRSPTLSLQSSTVEPTHSQPAPDLEETVGKPKFTPRFDGFKRAMYANDVDEVLRCVRADPHHFLVDRGLHIPAVIPCDLPEIKSKGAAVVSRWNGIHQAAFLDRPKVIEAILDEVNEHFGRLGLPDAAHARCLQQYLNNPSSSMPGKEGSLPASTLRLYRNTPLHVACMYGSLATIELLSQMQPLVDVGARNAAGMTPAECVGPPWRNNGSVEPTEEERDRMLALLQPRWYAPVVEPEEAGSPCEVGPVWSPEASAFDKPIIALAGPMSHHEASDFVKAWKSPTRVDRPSFQAWARSDANRGKIQGGRILAARRGVSFEEHWPCLGRLCNLGSGQGLRLLNDRLGQPDAQPFLYGNLPETEDIDALVAVSHANGFSWVHNLTPLDAREAHSHDAAGVGGHAGEGGALPQHESGVSVARALEWGDAAADHPLVWRWARSVHALLCLECSDRRDATADAAAAGSPLRTHAGDSPLRTSGGANGAQAVAADSPLRTHAADSPLRTSNSATEAEHPAILAAAVDAATAGSTDSPLRTSQAPRVAQAVPFAAAADPPPSPFHAAFGQTDGAPQGQTQKQLAQATAQLKRRLNQLLRGRGHKGQMGQVGQRGQHSGTQHSHESEGSPLTPRRAKRNESPRRQPGGCSPLLACARLGACGCSAICRSPNHQHPPHPSSASSSIRQRIDFGGGDAATAVGAAPLAGSGSPRVRSAAAESLRVWRQLQS